MNKIIPTVFAINKKEFKKRFDELVQISPFIQVDIMDGKLVKSKSINPKDLPNVSSFHINFEAHLMVKNPQKYLSMLKKKGFHKIIVHYEAFSTNKKLLETLFQIRDTMKMKAFIAINPETPIIKVFPLLAYVDGVLLMGVHPGKEHQDLIPEVFAKISVLRERDSKMPIQIDGGVNIKSINNLKKSGATIFNSGSFVAESKNPKKTLQLLQTA